MVLCILRHSSTVSINSGKKYSYNYENYSFKYVNDIAGISRFSNRMHISNNDSLYIFGEVYQQFEREKQNLSHW